MKRIDLIKVEHDTKIGQECPYIEPNIKEDCIFYEDGNPIGFYIKQAPEKIRKLADLADNLLRTKDVPKTIMDRGRPEKMKDGSWNYEGIVRQYSCLLGSIPPKPHVRRPYPTIAKTHSTKTAQPFIKAMLLLALESEKLMKEILPEQYVSQKKLFEEVPEKWRFGNLFTSSISNYNISAPFHRDTANIVGACNVIITKRLNAKGGNLHIPDYNATIDSANNSILVYPVWKNIHGVTPIIPTHKGGYRNSLVFYPLKAFVKFEN